MEKTELFKDYAKKQKQEKDLLKNIHSLSWESDRIYNAIAYLKHKQAMEEDLDYFEASSFRIFTPFVATARSLYDTISKKMDLKSMEYPKEYEGMPKEDLETEQENIHEKLITLYLAHYKVNRYLFDLTCYAFNNYNINKDLVLLDDKYKIEQDAINNMILKERCNEIEQEWKDYISEPVTRENSPSLTEFDNDNTLKVTLKNK